MRVPRYGDNGLSQAHFGNIFIRNDGSFDASPRAVTNAFYQAPFRELQGTDNAGFCDNWRIGEITNRREQ